MILLGDCLERLKELEDNSVDAVVTDPPYGLKFMGKKWDYDVPKVALWTEVLRVMKPGGHLLAFGGTRTYHRLVVAIEDAGFEIRDQIQWLYGSGFPKSHNIKEGKFKGFGTALKPANEPICLTRKPLDGTVVQNMLKWGVGGLNIDESRIGTESVPSKKCIGDKYAGFKGDKQGENLPWTYTQGRWPANLLLGCACDEYYEETGSHFTYCPVKMLDEQSGVSKGGKTYNYTGEKEYKETAFTANTNKPNSPSNRGDSGGASRFFYVAKASKRERNAGLEGMPEQFGNHDLGRFKENQTAASGKQERLPNANHHPTVKPIKLMEYLCKLITPPGGVILDPFMGSGSTLMAAQRLGFRGIGIEMNEEYAKIAEKRIEAVL